MKSELAKQMAAAVQLWLDFQVLCGRSMLLSEAYLAQPIGEFLKNHHSGPIKTEFNHPNIKSPGRGRPRQIDYVLLSRDNEKLVCAIEAKWINSQQTSKQRLIDDIFRLECVRRDDGQTMDRYFLVAGESEFVKKNFIDLQVNAGSGQSRVKFLESILTLDGDGKTIKVKDCHEVWRPYFKSFHKDYNVKSPISFRVSLVEDRVGEKVRVIIWRISSVPKRNTFSPSELWKDVKVTSLEDGV